MRRQISAEQRRLKEDEARRPHGGRSAEQWKNSLRRDRFEEEEKCAAEKDRDGKAAGAATFDSTGFRRDHATDMTESARSSSSASMSASSSENGIGGRIFRTLWCGPSVPSRMPRSRNRFAMNAASCPAGSRVSRL